LDINDIQIKVSGYVSEVFCGEIPVGCKHAFTRRILRTRNKAEIPPWLLKRCPDYVSPETIKRFWYGDDGTMKDLFSEQGAHWEGYRAVNHFHQVLGFGSGKEGIGLFEIVLEKKGKALLEFVPFDPPMETPHPLHKMDILRQCRLPDFCIPEAQDGHVAVTAGYWAKGTMIFPLRLAGSFRKEALEILVADLSALGVGEDCFVAGLRYGGRDLKGKIIRETEREMYQVVWYSHKRERWLDMYEME
jgi:hypothetical protein